MRPAALLAVSLLLPTLAWAQEDLGIDAHGFAMAPGDGDLKDYLSTWRPERQDAFSLGIDLLAEYANQPFVLIVKQNATDETRLGLIEHLVTANVGIAMGINERIAIDVSAPVYLYQSGDDGVGGNQTFGPAFGDLRLTVPINLVHTSDPKEKGSFGISVIPFGVAPTGPSARFLGQKGFGGGGLLAVGFDKGRFDLSTNIGAQYRPTTDIPDASGEPRNLTGGPDLLAALGLAYEITDRVGLRGEVNAVANLVPAPSELELAPATEVPIQAALSTPIYLSQHFSLTAGLGTALTRGAGAAPLRAFLGINAVIGKSHPIDRDGDGFADSLDECKDAAETFNDYKDDDGCPDELAAVTFEAKDPNGEPVQGAVVAVDGESIGATNSRGLVTTSDRMPGTTAAYQASAVGFMATTGEAAFVEGAQTIAVAMPWEPRPVRVIAHDPDGVPVAATAAFSGGSAHDPVELGDDGTEVVPLTPGSWTVTLTEPQHESARAPLSLAPGTSEQVLEMTMMPKRVSMGRTEVVIMGQIHFDFDKATIKADSATLLDEIAKVIKDNPQVHKIEIQGHTSDEGTSEYNMDLSVRRMDAVVEALVTRGVEKARLVPKGFGETVPLAPNDSEEHRAANRRVQFVILEQDTGSAP